MNDFFVLPERAPEPRPRPAPAPPWLSHPHGTLPGIVALELILAATPLVAVCVTRIAAHPTGFELDLLTMADPNAGEELDSDPLGMHGPHRRGGGASDAERLRFGVQFADGSKATNLDDWGRPSSGPPPGPVLRPGGGGGGGGDWRQQFWVWPLPPPGPLTLVCEWPGASIPLTRHELDAALVRAAAERAQVVFPPGHGGGGWTTATAFR